MADGPYVLDFLQQITNIQFGGAWIAIYAQSNLSGTAEIDFPGISGGTPGFILLNGATASPGGPSSKSITAKDLAHQVDTLAGQALTGFSISTFRPPVPPSDPGFVGSVLFLQCSGHLAKTFDMKMTLTFPTSFEDAGVSVFLWKDAVKAGVAINVLGMPTPPNPDAQADNVDAPVPDTNKVNFTVDPQKLTITMS